MDAENDVIADYAYDSGGNIVGKMIREWNSDFSSPVAGSVTESITYTYGDSEWKDLLTSYNGQTITYDAIGNPLTYRDGITLTWQNGRRLASYSDGSRNVSYTYDASGMRTSKNISDIMQVDYVYEDGLLLQMNYNGYVFDFSYDAYGSPVGFRYINDGVVSYYYYGLNSRGDIVSIFNHAGGEVVQYSYDAYGKLMSTVSATGYSNIAAYNPLRYRGYVYDNETGFYYLQSRYYDPTTCRFVNADTIIDGGAGIVGSNLFVYAANNPINNSDATGQWIIKDAIKWVASNIVKPVVNQVRNIVSSLGNTTRTTGVSVSGAFGIEGSLSGGITSDNLGNIGLTGSYSYGGGSPNASVGIYKTITTAPSVENLKGTSFQMGGSVDVPPVNIGLDYTCFTDSETMDYYHGGTFTVGFGIPIVPAELHGEFVESGVVYFNIYDSMEKIYINIMEW